MGARKGGCVESMFGDSKPGYTDHGKRSLHKTAEAITSQVSFPEADIKWYMNAKQKITGIANQNHHQPLESKKCHQIKYVPLY